MAIHDVLTNIRLDELSQLSGSKDGTGSEATYRNGRFNC